MGAFENHWHRNCLASCGSRRVVPEPVEGWSLSLVERRSLSFTFAA
jgi:hypothetical protein